MAAKPYTLNAQVTLPPDDGQPAAIRDLLASGSFTHKVESELVLPTSGTRVVSFGTIPASGAKLVMLEYPVTTVADAEINLLINGSVTPFPISPGGGVILSSPTPGGSGITSLSIVHTTTGTVKVTLLA